MKKTILIQGVLTHTEQGRWPVQLVIDSIRKWYKDEIVLSTWKHQDVSSIQNVDKIVQAEDPGPGPNLFPNQSNLTRQLIGFQLGLKYSTGDLIFKIRSDTAVYGDIFKHYDSSDTGSGRFSMFSKKITVSNIMTIDPDTQHELRPLFRICDWMHLGLKHDLEKYCDILEEINSQDYANSGLCPESLWFTTALKKYVFSDLDQFNLEKHRDVVWNCIINNFKIVNTNSTARVYNLTKWKNQPENLHCYLTEQKYKQKFNNFKEIK